MQVIKINDGVSACFIENKRFKSRLMSVRFMLPLEAETVTENAMAAELISGCSKAYPEPERLERELKRLYGAEISVGFEKNGDNQVITFFARSISDDFGIDDKPFSRIIEILFGIIFEPKIENNAFSVSDVERTKRIWKEKIGSRLNDKRIFAKERLEEVIFSKEGYGISPYGYKNKIDEASAESLYKAYLRLINEAKIRITITAPERPDEAINKFLQAFKNTERHSFISQEIAENREVKTEIERMNITQGKLTMGFKLPIKGGDRETAAITVLGDIFGGGPYSKLFSVVREKMSLCYYCSARTYRIKGLMEVESGVNDENAEKAKEAILEQLEDIKRGNFEDETLKSSILSICESLNSSADKISTEDIWYGSRMFDESPLSPKEFAELIKTVTREDVINLAKGVKLLAVYLLMGEEKA